MDSLPETLLIGFLVIVLYIAWNSQRRPYPRTGLKGIPEVGGWLPIIGHGIQMGKNPIAFFEACHLKYGDTFLVRFGMVKVAVLAGRDLVIPFTRATEESISMHAVSEFTCLCNMTCSFEKPLDVAIPYMRAFLVALKSTYTPAVLALTHSQIDKTAATFAKGESKAYDLKDFVNHTFRSPLFESLFGTPESPETTAAFDALISSAVGSMRTSYFLPQFLVKWMALRLARRDRGAMIHLVLDTVEEFLKNPTKNDPLPVRFTADYVPKQLDRSLTPTEVCDLLLGLYFVLEGNPPALATQLLKELANQPELWNKLRGEIQGGSKAEENKLLEACVLEAARCNSKPVGLNGVCFPNSEVGGWDLAKADHVTLAGNLFFQGPLAKGIHKTPEVFMPERYLGENPEPSNRGSLWVWGSGVHACPARSLTIKLIQIYVAKVITTFDIQLVSVSEKKYDDINSTAHQDIRVQVGLA